MSALEWWRTQEQSAVDYAVAEVVDDAYEVESAASSLASALGSEFFSGFEGLEGGGITGRRSSRRTLLSSAPSYHATYPALPSAGDAAGASGAARQSSPPATTGAGGAAVGAAAVGATAAPGLPDVGSRQPPPPAVGQDHPLSLTPKRRVLRRLWPEPPSPPQPPGTASKRVEYTAAQFRDHLSTATSEASPGTQDWMVDYEASSPRSPNTLCLLVVRAPADQPAASFHFTLFFSGALPST